MAQKSAISVTFPATISATREVYIQWTRNNIRKTTFCNQVNNSTRIFIYRKRLHYIFQLRGQVNLLRFHHTFDTEKGDLSHLLKNHGNLGTFRLMEICPKMILVCVHQFYSLDLIIFSTLICFLILFFNDNLSGAREANSFTTSISTFTYWIPL